MQPTIIHTYLQNLFDDLFTVDYLNLWNWKSEWLVVKKYWNSGCKFAGAFIIFIVEWDNIYINNFIQFANSKTSENDWFFIKTYDKNDIIHNHKFIIYIS